MGGKVRGGWWIFWWIFWWLVNPPDIRYGWLMIGRFCISGHKMVYVCTLRTSSSSFVIIVVVLVVTLILKTFLCRFQARRLKQTILEGSWDAAVGIVNASDSFISSHQRDVYVYALLRQEYLELIDRQEYQKAFSFLTKRLKPIESSAIWSNDSFPR